MKKRIYGLLVSAVAFVMTFSVDAKAADVVTDSELVQEGYEVSCPTGGLMPFEVTYLDEIDESRIGIDLTKPEGDESLSSAVYNDPWEKYSNNVVYNQLPEDKKQVWDAFDALCREYFNSSANKNGLEYVCVPDSSFNSTGDIMNFLSMYKYTNPQYFFLANGISMYGMGGNIYITYSTYNRMDEASFRNEAKSNFAAGIDEFKAEINKRDLSNDEAKIKAIHDVICEKVVYNHTSVSTGHVNEQSEYTQSAYSTFTLKSTVCAGYAQAFALLCQEYGIDCMAVTSPGHAYNRVMAYDSWYNIDTTWDDQSWGYGYWYYLKSDADFAQDGSSHVVDPEWSEYALPCTMSSTADYYYGGISAPNRSQKTDEPLITFLKNSDNVTVTITAEPGAYIYYSIDGEDPHSSYTRCLRYREPFVAAENATVKAIAIHDGKYNSEVVTEIVGVGVEPCITLTEQSLTLDGEISINVYARIPDEIRNASGAYVMLNGNKVLLKNITSDSNGESVFSFGEKAKNMHDVETLYFCYADGNKVKLLNSAGVPIDGDTYNSSVYDFSVEVLNSSTTSAEYKNLAKSLIDYGGYAQDYFGYSMESIAKMSSPKELSNITASTLTPYDKSISGSLPEGAFYVGSSLILDSNTAVRHYFSGNLANCVFYIDGNQVSLVTDGGTKYIEVSGIPGYDLGKNHVVKAIWKDNRNQSQTYQINYSVLSYAKAALEKSTPDKLKDVMRTMYNYNAAVKSLFDM